MPGIDTHPHPALIDPSNWCTNCHHHLAAGLLCPVCLDNRLHDIELRLSRPLLDGKGTE